MSKPTASKGRPKKSMQAVTKGEMEQLLADQASMILNAVDGTLSAQERRSNTRLEKMEERFAKRIDELTKTLDKFLKRVSDIEEEFTFMKADLNRVKAVLREKLGVVLDQVVMPHLLSTIPRLARSFVCVFSSMSQQAHTT
jgi:hypothetical protein